MKDCCKDNLGAPEPLSDDLVLRVCGVCGSKHYKLTVDIGETASEGVEA